jgi:alanine racemase
MVKADAYGHDAIFTSKALLKEKSLFGFGVATLREACALRLGLRDSKVPIIVFSDSAPWTSDHLKLCLQYALEPVFSEITSLLQFQAQRNFLQVSAHVEINTGMNRMGIPPESLSLIRFYPRSVFTHLAEADLPSDPLTRTQMRTFSGVVEQVRQKFPKALLHFSNSSAIWNHAKFSLTPEMDLARPGLSLYGIRPFDRASNDGLKRVMQMTSQVLNRIHLSPGDRVGYGGTYRCKKPGGEWISVIGGGYADGIFRALSNRGIAYHGAKKLRFRGRVSMDLSAVEGHSKIQIGDFLELWGDRIDPYEQAGLAETIPYEITTRVGARVERVYES